jgi:hypothetical protein
MSIVFSCTCGKRLQAPDEFAGRRMKCKTCGAVLAIPKTTSASKPAPVKAKPPAALASPPTSPQAPLAEPNPWAYRSLQQRITFWRVGDAARPGASDKVPRGSSLAMLVGFVLCLCLVGAAWFFLAGSS